MFQALPGDAEVRRYHRCAFDKSPGDGKRIMVETNPTRLAELAGLTMDQDATRGRLEPVVRDSRPTDLTVLLGDDSLTLPMIEVVGGEGVEISVGRNVVPRWGCWNSCGPLPEVTTPPPAARTSSRSTRARTVGGTEITPRHDTSSSANRSGESVPEVRFRIRRARIAEHL